MSTITPTATLPMDSHQVAPASAAPSAAGQEYVDDHESKGSTEIVQMFVQNLGDIMNSAITEISNINSDTQLLALNARIEAARAGSMGAAFGVVAQEMQALSSKTSTIAHDLASTTQSTIAELMELIGSNVRGTRLSDLALTNIDLVDRNLYERTCDVRWWATDSSLVDALSDHNEDAYSYASHRLGVILDAYTVYYDLVLCDLEGNIVANGRPNRYHSAGQQVGRAEWFRAAMASRSGDEYGFQSAHPSHLVNDQQALIYSCGVRENGLANGKLLGVLGILFNWEEFSQAILDQVPLAESERESTRSILCEANGRILADSAGKGGSPHISLPSMEQLFREKKNYVITDYEGRQHCIAHAQAPGFETYSTGWHSVILQPTS